MKKERNILLFSVLIMSLLFNSCNNTNENKIEQYPNIVLILADDMGYGDVQAYNKASAIPTTNVNTLAEEGMKFTDAHSNSAVCSPTRYGILPGRYAWRTSKKRGVLIPESPPWIQKNRLTIGKMLKKKNYNTGTVGKWHLGIEWNRNQEGEIDFNQPFISGPTDLGFDYYHGVIASLDMVPYTFYENKTPVQPVTEHQQGQSFPGMIRPGPKASDFDHSKALDQLTDKAVNYIKRQADQENTFFLYFALTSPHLSISPAKRFQGVTGLGPYADFIAQTDWTVGQVLQALEEKGVEDNTLVLFTSDNGSYMHRIDADQKYPVENSLTRNSFKARTAGDGQQDHASDATVNGYYPYVHQANDQWRGTKGDIWEAGYRVPFIVRWPEKIESNNKSSQTVSVTDIMATLGDMVDYSDETGQDSFSLLPILTGKSKIISRPPVVHQSFDGMFALRKGPWKMVFGNGSGGRQVPQGSPFTKPYQLFNLENDPQETINVIDQYSDIAQEMTDMLDEIRRD